jgi:hypothetical protein
MLQALLWIYLVNAVLVTVHEIDSAYWKEWELFKLPGGITFFLILHLFLIFVILLGIVFLLQNVLWGLVLSLILGLSGVLAFNLHNYFIKKGRTEFKTPISQSILIATLIVSLVQLAATLYVIITGY